LLIEDSWADSHQRDKLAGYVLKQRIELICFSQIRPILVIYFKVGYSEIIIQ
jgi:hypothetical protein